RAAGVADFLDGGRVRAGAAGGDVPGIVGCVPGGLQGVAGNAWGLGLTIETARRANAMPTIYVRLDPRRLQNPDADIRYLLPDLIVEQSCGVVKDDGYDYVGDAPYLLLFLKADDVDQGKIWVLDVLEHEDVAGNDLLAAAVVAVERNGQKEVVYPRN